VMCEHAQAVHEMLMSAMDDVEQQFKGGMAPLLATKLPELSEPTRLEMITACIRAFRIGFDRPWAVSHLESLLSTRELARSSSDPVGWLAFLVLGKVELPTSATLGTFLTVTVASYLDPFIDGEVPAHQYTARSRGFFIERLQAAWARGPGAKGAPMELPREYVLAQYVTHTVTKMNAHFVTSRDHPASEHEIRRYLDRLSHGIVDAIARDFTIEDRRLGALSCLTPRHIAKVGRLHLRGLFAYQNKLANALANANADGEDVRAKERMSIFGYAMMHEPA